MVDIVLLALLALFALKGWRAGFISMLLALAFLIIAGFIASMFASQLGTVLGLSNAYMRPVVGFLVIFAIVVAVGSWFRGFLRPKRGVLRGMDGLLGAALGLVRGAFILSVVLIVLRLFNWPSETARDSSTLYPLVLKTSTTVVHVLRPYAHLPERDTTV